MFQDTVVCCVLDRELADGQLAASSLPSQKHTSQKSNPTALPALVSARSDLITTRGRQGDLESQHLDFPSQPTARRAGGGKVWCQLPTVPLLRPGPPTAPSIPGGWVPDTGLPGAELTGGAAGSLSEPWPQPPGYATPCLGEQFCKTDTPPWAMARFRDNMLFVSLPLPPHSCTQQTAGTAVPTGL